MTLTQRLNRAGLLGMLDWADKIPIDDLPFSTYDEATAWLVGWHYAAAEHRFEVRQRRLYDARSEHDHALLKNTISAEILSQTHFYPSPRLWLSYHRVCEAQLRWKALDRYAVDCIRAHQDGDGGKKLAKFNRLWPREIDFIARNVINVKGGILL